MTRSVEIPEAAVEAGARVLNPNIFAKPDTEDWQDVVRGTARAVLEAAAPHLVEQEEFPNGDTGTALAEWLYNRFSGRRGPDSAPWVARTAETHGYWEHEAEAVLRALPYLAPAGDGGLREALEKVKQAKRRLWAGLMAVKPKLDEPYPDDARWTPWTRFVGPRLDDLWAAFDALLLAAHPCRACRTTTSRPRSAGEGAAGADLAQPRGYRHHRHIPG